MQSMIMRKGSAVLQGLVMSRMGRQRDYMMERMTLVLKVLEKILEMYGSVFTRSKTLPASKRQVFKPAWRC